MATKRVNKNQSSKSENSINGRTEDDNEQEEEDSDSCIFFFSIFSFQGTTEVLNWCISDSNKTFYFRFWSNNSLFLNYCILLIDG